MEGYMAKLHGQSDKSYKRREGIQELLWELEAQAQYSDMNIDHLLKKYKREYPDEAMWMLVQDINRQALVWFNIIEVLKHGDEPEMRKMKKHYEDRLQLLPEDTLSNPMFQFDIDKAFDRLRNYGRALLKIASSYSLELMAGLNLEVGVTGVVEVSIGLPPALTIGFEKSFTASATASVSAARG
jgi:hypothetical protein